jgi:hypothetical protein
MGGVKLKMGLKVGCESIIIHLSHLGWSLLQDFVNMVMIFRDP